ncbi:MAG: hypothetical protein R6W81_01025 [Bacteroidales bacterium]
MKHIIGRYMIIMGLAVAGLIWNGEIQPISVDLMAMATEESLFQRLDRSSN